MTLPIECREDAIFEVAKLGLWLEQRIIEQKTAVPIERIDPYVERQMLDSPMIQQRMENTARVCADGIWKKLQTKWHKQHNPIITDPSSSQLRHKKRKLVTARPQPGVRDQHFSPVFSNKYWANAANKVRIYTRGVDSNIKSRDVGYKTWGWEAFLYSQWLERWFSLVEGDAKIPYRKLSEMIPLNEKDRRHWIAFIIAQLFRTPSFILKNLAGMKKLIEAKQWDYGTDTASLRRSFETLFTNNDVFAHFYTIIMARRWHILRASTAPGFIRSDNPVVTTGRYEDMTWLLVYPMTPEKCLVVGPSAQDPSHPVVPEWRELDKSETVSINQIVAWSARQTVIARPSEDDGELKGILLSNLGMEWLNSKWLKLAYPEYWNWPK